MFPTDPDLARELLLDLYLKAEEVVRTATKTEDEAPDANIPLAGF
jgi:hypothetical protein